MANNLDRIVTVAIDIASPIADSSSFDNLLILGPAPAAADHTAPAVGVFSSLDEVTGTGYIAIGESADIVGVAARIAFSQSPRPTQVYIATMEADGTVADVLERAAAMDGWYVICPVGLTEAQLKEVMEWTEAHEKVCAFTCLDTDADYGTIYYRSFGIFGKETYSQGIDDVPAANKCMAVGWVAKTLHYHAGSETWAHKQIAGVNPSELTSTEIAALEEKNISYFITTAGKNITYIGKVLAGEWIDVIRFRDWLKNDMQVRVANIFIVNPKVPYTDPGIALVENKMLESLKSGVNYGGIAPDEYDENGDVIPGFKTSVPLAASLSDTQRASRKLIDCKFAARIAGAIHVVDINGSLTYSL